jgi:hypothetical protein
MMAVTDLVTDPDSFMERKIKGRRLRWEFVLLLVVGGLGAPGAAYVSRSLLEEAGEGGDFLQFQLVGFVIEPVIGIFLVWLGYAVVGHLIASRAFNGRGPLKRLLKSSAWALVPVGVGNLARTVAIYFAFRDESLPDNPEGDTLVEQFQSVLEVGMDKPEVMAAAVVLIITVLYSGYLLSFAIEHSKNVGEDDARKAAAVPAGAFALYLLWGLL